MEYIIYGILGLLFIFIMTTLGSLTICFIKQKHFQYLSKVFMSFASGVMFAASIFSLIIPALEEAEKQGYIAWIPVAASFLLGGFFLYIIDIIINKRKTAKKLGKKLFIAVTLHNIPEGLAVGLGFGLALANNDPSLLPAAIGLALAIGIQNFPEGAALALPLLDEVKDKKKTVVYSVLSGAVEPIFGILGLMFAYFMAYSLPWLLAFAAGSMIYVIIDDLIPSNRSEESVPTISWGFMLGFIVMLILDVAL